MTAYTFIVNPTAGKGSAARMPEALRKLLESRKVDYQIVLTDGPTHATVLAAEADSPVVVSVGGDGTLNEVVNGILGTGKSLGIVPCGSGNDFIKSVGIPRKLDLAVDKCFTGNVLHVDVGTVLCGSVPTGKRLFLNGVGIGFDAEVAVRTRGIKYLRGLAVYLLAVFQTLRAYQNPILRVSLDGMTSRGKHLLIAVGNGTCAGGGFYLTPKAVVDDGELDFCMIGDAGVGRILRLMPLVLWGKHLSKTDIVTYSRGRELEVTSESPIFVHADGEIVGQHVQEVRIGLDERRLPVLV